MLDSLKKAVKVPLIVVFALIIIALSIADALIPDKAISDLENRPLAQKPVLNLESLFDNEHAQKYEEYVNDQFVLRNEWISAKALLEAVTLKAENNGILFGKDGYLFEKQFTGVDKKFGQNLGFVTEFANKYPDQNITFAIIPSAYEVLRDKLPLGAVNINQRAYIESAYTQLHQNNVSTIDMLGKLNQHADEEIYYRTDHHWTTLGAYYGYVAYCEQKGLTPVSLDTLEKTEVADFYGTHYSKAKRIDIKPDVLTYYDIPTTQVTVNNEQADGIYDYDKLETRDKYAMFLRGNNAMTVIKSDNNLNKSDKPTRVLVAKDSYFNSMAGFLTYNYDEVYVVDLRYLSVMSLAMSQAEFDDVLIIYNFGNFSTDNNISKLKY